MSVDDDPVGRQARHALIADDVGVGDDQSTIGVIDPARPRARAALVDAGDDPHRCGPDLGDDLARRRRGRRRFRLGREDTAHGGGDGAGGDQHGDDGEQRRPPYGSLEAETLDDARVARDHPPDPRAIVARRCRGGGLGGGAGARLDPHAAGADPQRVSRRQRDRPLDPAPVDERAVAGAEVADLDTAVDLLQVGVAPRDLRIVEDEVAALVAADHETLLGADLEPSLRCRAGEDDQLCHRIGPRSST